MRSRTDGVLIAAGGWHDEVPGGAYKLATDFARFLASRGRPVTYICPSPGVSSVTRDRIDAVDVLRYPSPAAESPSLLNVRAHLAHARELTRATGADEGVSVLLGHSQLQYLGALSACPPGARRCFAVHSPFALEIRQNASGSPTFKQRLSWRAAGWMERRIVRSSDLIHCDSAFTLGLLVDTYGEAARGKAVVLPGWVDCTRFVLPRRSRAALRASLGTPWRETVPTFLSLRRLFPRMGIDTLIDSAALLVDRGYKFRVVIAGEGPLRADLEARARARKVDDIVSFIGRVAQAQLPDLYAAADCFVLPTRALECFGLIVLESYACGTPVIGVPVGAIPEVIGAALSAWLATANDAASIAQRMAAFLDGTLRADAARLRSRALEFDAASIMARHEQTLFPVPAHMRGEVA